MSASNLSADRSSAGGLGATIARNALFTVISRLTFFFAWALVTPYMLGVLGEDRFAIWTLFFALSGYFQIFDLGLSQALVKYVAQFSAAGDTRGLRGVVTMGTFAYIGLATPVVIGLALFQRPVLDAIHTPQALRAEAGWTLIGIAIVIGLNNLSGVITAVLSGRQRMDITSRVLLLVTAIQVGGAILALRTGGGLRGMVVAYGLGVLIGALISFRAMRTVEPEARLDISSMSRSLFGELFRFGSALQITNLGTFIQFQLDKFLLAHLVSLAMVTRYELASRLALAAWALPTFLIIPLVPAVSQLGSLADHDRILRLYTRASRYIAAVAFPVAGFMIATASALIVAWLGTSYSGAAIGTVGIISFLLLTMLTGVGTSVCRGLGAPWMEVQYHVVGTLIHVGLSLWLIPRMGINGALIAQFISGAVSVSFFLWRLHRWIQVPFGPWLRGVIVTPLAVSITAAVLAIVWRGGLLAAPAGRVAAWFDIVRAMAVFAIVIVAGYFATRFLTWEEVRNLGRSTRA